MLRQAATLVDAALHAASDRYGDLCMSVILDVTRAYSREALERAITATIDAFPVLGARYAPGFWRDVWVPLGGDAREALVVEPEGDLEALTDRWLRATLDPLKERPLRVVAIPRGAGMRIIVQLLHLAVDGAGVAAVGHVFAAHLHGAAPSVPTDVSRSLFRPIAGLRWYHAPVALRGAASNALRPFRHALAARRRRPYPGDATAAATWRTTVLDRDAVLRLRARCDGATLNDVLVGVLGRVAAARAEGSSVVVTYTMDLRRYAGPPHLLAANASSVMSAVLPRSALGSLTSAVRAASHATRRDRDDLYGPAFLLGPALLDAIVPHGLARRVVPFVGDAVVDVQLDRGLAVTNVGRIDDGLRHFGDAIENVRIVGPRTSGIPVPIVVAFGFRGALHLEMYAGPGVGAERLEVLEREIRAAMEIGP